MEVLGHSNQAAICHQCKSNYIKVLKIKCALRNTENYNLKLETLKIIIMIKLKLCKMIANKKINHFLAKTLLTTLILRKLIRC